MDKWTVVAVTYRNERTGKEKTVFSRETSRKGALRSQTPLERYHCEMAKSFISLVKPQDLPYSQIEKIVLGMNKSNTECGIAEAITCLLFEGKLIVNNNTHHFFWVE